MTPKQRSATKQHAEVERLDIFGTALRMSPVGLIYFAKNFLSAARAAALEDGTRFSPAKHCLACHSIELALKAFLSMKRVSLVELMSRHCHGLSIATSRFDAGSHGTNLIPCRSMGVNTWFNEGVGPRRRCRY